jgi:MOSC domain-containing protein YiiM
MIRLAVVNVGTPTVLAEARGENVWSGIRKLPVAASATLWLSSLNLSGDGQADLSVHGGVDKAVYAYPSEHLAPWTQELGEELGPAPFGENLSTIGALETDVRIGDMWSWGDALLQVSQPRWPCFKLALYRSRADIQQRMRAHGRTGWYLRVLGLTPPASPSTTRTAR